MHTDDELRRCLEEIRRLKVENQDLRRASEAFGHLAERLNQELYAERRRRAADGRQSSRGVPDRRIAS